MKKFVKATILESHAGGTGNRQPLPSNPRWKDEKRESFPDDLVAKHDLWVQIELKIEFGFGMGRA